MHLNLTPTTHVPCDSHLATMVRGPENGIQGFGVWLRLAEKAERPDACAPAEDEERARDTGAPAEDEDEEES